MALSSFDYYAMARNIEIKARVPDPAALRARAVGLATAEPEVLMQRDTFYNAPAGRLKLREFADGTAELIYYERPDQPGPKTSIYSRTPVPDAASMRDLLARCLGAKAVVAKSRELFLIGATRVHLDQVERLGSFMELEVVLAAGQTDAEGEQIACDLMAQFGIREADLVDQAYVDLLERVSV
jgi:predicted adenylyl cyclase CyaB